MTKAQDIHRRRIPPWLREIAVLVVVALMLSVSLQTFVGRVYLIPSESMEPTLHGCKGCTGDRIVVDKMTFRFGDPEPGDVVVFRAPTMSWNVGYNSARSTNPIAKALQDAGSWAGLVAPDENDLVKRVIAIGGQTVQCCDAQGRVEVDGQPLDEPYVVMDFPFVEDTLTCETAPRSGRCFGPVTVPSGNLWMMGDNRSGSADSRAHSNDELGGTVPIGDVIGKARLIVLPPSRWGTIESPPIQQH
ncbi:signal peptidase I [Rhodococcus sp. IEGM 1401]|uniref:signal peptidase I n=1 Tax=unclassified Rhodococcus (in: high G+C Gram-positive bacteria) TaxID=192944 RepID=UPI0022B58E51|nr:MULTISPECIES: signal peptidase I [unclassified Rhodococcus (in: high G+C Gram-positive bacteria)]MCZ4563645.1 signal peptidase I [Rhodococcus sp. IEGM 1401]MDI9923745.1 signal peptidase I [Rhodococcus sp. IEGM 1372]MDV8036238.1 signal peptidase I [Rhodococcus sp. IEGM 1414]